MAGLADAGADDPALGFQDDIDGCDKIIAEAAPQCAKRVSLQRQHTAGGCYVRMFRHAPHVDQIFLVVISPGYKALSRPLAWTKAVVLCS
jgi:hypothetical protein